MAFNLQTFKTRAFSAIVFVIVMLVGMLLNGWSFIMLFIIIHFGCWYELLKLTRKMLPVKYPYYLPLGLLYITLPVLMLIDLGFTDTGRYLNKIGYDDAFQYSAIIPSGIIFSIWVNDTMAYIVGSLIGKTSLSKISPQKTWEGTLGGGMLCIAVIAFIGWKIKFYTLQDWFFIAAICAVFGTIGDLLESKLKRMAQVKDSGTIMPGHGGFLDRFDSLLIATPFVWVYVHFFMQRFLK